MDLFEKCDHFETLKQVRKLGIYPYFHELESRQAPVVQMENHRVIIWKIMSIALAWSSTNNQSRTFSPLP